MIYRGIKNILKELIHRLIDDGQDTTTSTWSSRKVKDSLDAKEASMKAYADRDAELLWSGRYWTSNGSITLSKPIDDYKAVLVIGAMYTDTDEQRVCQYIPKAMYYPDTTNNYPYSYLLNGSIASTNRRIFFGFNKSEPKKLYTSTVEGSSGHIPALVRVYGIR